MNYDIIHFFSQHITTLAITTIVFMFFFKMYQMRYAEKKIYVVTFVLWTGVMMWVNSYNIGLLNLMVFLISAETICLFFFNTSFFKSLLYNVMLFMLLFFNDIISYIIWSAAYGKSTVEIASDSNLLIISNLLNILLSFSEYKVIIALANKSDITLIKKQETAFLLFMTVIECYIIHCLFKNIENDVDSYITLIILMTFLIFNIYVTYIINKVAELYKYKYDTELINTQSAIQLEHYMEMEHTYQEARHIIHDMKQHLTVMEDLNNSESSEYSSTLENRLESLFGGFQCSNRILSIIIGRKYKTAESKGIQVKLDVEDIDLDFMEDLDITGIFANLWDNAIEACENMEPQKRKILFMMNKVNGFIIVNMENTYYNVEYNKMRANSLSTTKENHMGVGLSVIKNTVEKYDGLFNVVPNERKFVVEITMPLSK